MLTQHFTPCGYPIYLAPNHLQRQHGGDRGISMGAVANSRIKCPACRAHIGSSFGPHKDRRMAISPVIGMTGKKAGRYTQGSHALNLVVTTHLCVNK